MLLLLLLLLTLGVRVESRCQRSLSQGLAAHPVTKGALSRVERRRVGLLSSVVVHTVGRLVAVPGVIRAVLHFTPVSRPAATCHHPRLASSRVGGGVTASAAPIFLGSGRLAARTRRSVVEQGGALSEAASTSRAAERLLIMDLLMSGQGLAAVERPLTDAAGKRTSSRVDDAMLEEVASLLESLATLGAAEGSIWARGPGGLARATAHRAIRGQTVAAEVAAEAGEVGEGLATFAAVVEWFRFGLARTRCHGVEIFRFGDL